MREGRLFRVVLPVGRGPRLQRDRELCALVRLPGHRPIRPERGLAGGWASSAGGVVARDGLCANRRFRGSASTRRVRGLVHQGVRARPSRSAATVMRASVFHWKQSGPHLTGTPERGRLFSDRAGWRRGVPSPRGYVDPDLGWPKKGLPGARSRRPR